MRDNAGWDGGTKIEGRGKEWMDSGSMLKVKVQVKKNLLTKWPWSVRDHEEAMILPELLTLAPGMG